MAVYRNASAAVAEVEDLANEGEILNTPDNLMSPFISIDPPTHFTGVEQPANISIKIDDSSLSSGITMYRANRNSAWVFTELDTQVVEGQAVAQTDQGGIFVVGSGTSYALIAGVVVAAVVLVLVVTVVVGTIVYFVARPEKWKSAKNNMKKTQMKLKRSFAKQV